MRSPSVVKLHLIPNLDFYVMVDRCRRETVKEKETNLPKNSKKGGNDTDERIVQRQRQPGSNVHTNYNIIFRIYSIENCIYLKKYAGKFGKMTTT